MKRCITLSRGISLGIALALAAALLSACATIPAPSRDSSLILARLNLRASGSGTSPLGALGTVNTTQFSRAALKIKSLSDGSTYKLSTYGPEDLFVLPNVKAGRYEIVRLWGQVRTGNSVVTLTTSYTKSPSFEVTPNRVVNLGVIGWNFVYDLSSTSAMATGSVTFDKDYSAVTARFSQLHPASPWSRTEASAADVRTAGAAAQSTARALPPRGGYSSTIIP